MFAFESFIDSIKEIGLPKVIIIERNSSIRKAFCELKLEKKYDIKLQYCQAHLSKSLKNQVRNMISQNSTKFSEDTKHILLSVEKLPLIENHFKFQAELDRIKDRVKNSQEIFKQHQTVH
jgi:hypothetical protein